MKKLKMIMMAVLVFGLAHEMGFCQAQDKLSAEYRIGPKDVIDLTVYGFEQLNKSYRVSEEGKISLPFLGEILVDGMTKSQLEKDLARLLLEKEYLNNPQVTVFIREFQSKRVSVLGAVGRPGQIDLIGRQTLLQIITMAGGLTPDAGNDIIIMRLLPDGSTTPIKISIDDLILKGDAKLNIPLEPNDIVNIPVDKVVTVYVMGQVKNPGALQVKKSNIPSLLQAVAQAGGFTERAKKGSVLIKRKDKDGQEKQIKVNVSDIIKGKIRDVQLEENDVVFVPETWF